MHIIILYFCIVLYCDYYFYYANAFWPADRNVLLVTNRNRNANDPTQECIVKMEFKKRRSPNETKEMTRCYCHIFIDLEKGNLLFHFVTFVSNALLLFLSFFLQLAHAFAPVHTHTHTHTTI